jgi:hypothetical protein
MTYYFNYMNPILEGNLCVYKRMGYVFKSCEKEWIVVLKKTENTLTNEARADIRDENHAKFRGSEFMVMNIINKFDNRKRANTLHSSGMSMLLTPILYEIGEIAIPHEYDNDINNVCSCGIHYFKDPESAYYYELYYENSKRNGLYREWHHSGQLAIEYTYTHGYENGLCKEWWENGQISIECTYNYGVLDGSYREWYENGQIEIDRTYKDGEIDGSYREWDENGSEKTLHPTYKDDYSQRHCDFSS